MAVDRRVPAAGMMAPEAFVTADYEAIDPTRFDYGQRYKLFTGSVIPRPIALVTTRHGLGHINAAPFSQFIIVAVEPGLLGFSVGARSQIEKDTLRNVRAHPEFVINTVSDQLAVATQLCAQEFPPEVSEVAEARLSLIPSDLVKVDRIAESKIQFECRLHSITRFGASHLVVGEVLRMHALKGLVSDGKVDHAAFAALGRIAGRNYCRTSDIFGV